MLFLAVVVGLAACSRPGASDGHAAGVDVDATGDSARPDVPRSVPLQEFVVAFHKASAAAGHAVDGRYQFPAIWLYTPAGRLHSRVDDEAALARLSGTFAAADPEQAGLDSLGREDVATILADFGTPPPPPSGRWTALVLLDASECGPTGCGPWGAAADALLEAHPDSLDIVRVALAK
ncbi:MAG TPA: hypothetical protein VIG97_11930 [Luteimonas sp.]